MAPGNPETINASEPLCPENFWVKAIKPSLYTNILLSFDVNILFNRFKIKITDISTFCLLISNTIKSIVYPGTGTTVLTVFSRLSLS